MWVKEIASLKNTPPNPFIHWMEKPKNLGDALRKVCNHLSLNLLEQSFHFPLPDELELLDVKSSENLEACFLRKIILEGDGVPFTYGRVVVPKAVYFHHLDKFNQLGSRLIGETLLYGNPNATRSEFEFNELDTHHAIFTSIKMALPQVKMPKSFWARRSVFSLGNNEKILITEAFFANIPEYME